MTDSNPSGVTLVGPDQVPEVAGLLSQAFASDPLMAWLLPGRDRPARLRAMYDVLLPRPVAQGRVLSSEPRGSVLRYEPPGDLTRPTLVELVRLAPLAVHVGDRRAAVRVLRSIMRARPADPHWHLASLGTDPVRQRKGLAGRLLAALLSAADITRLPTHLETSQPANLDFYRRFGFVVVEAIDIADAPRMWAMRRTPPRPTDADCPRG